MGEGENTMKRIIIIIMSITMIISSCTILTGCDNEGVTASPVGVWELSINNIAENYPHKRTITITEENITIEEENESFTCSYTTITDGSDTYLELEEGSAYIAMINNNMLAVFSVYESDMDDTYKFQLPNGVAIDAETSMETVYFRQGSGISEMPTEIQGQLKEHFSDYTKIYYPSSEIIALWADGYGLKCFYISNGQLTYIEQLSLDNLPQSQYEDDDIFTDLGYVITDCM